MVSPEDINAAQQQINAARAQTHANIATSKLWAEIAQAAADSSGAGSALEAAANANRAEIARDGSRAARDEASAHKSAAAAEVTKAVGEVTKATAQAVRAAGFANDAMAAKVAAEAVPATQDGLMSSIVADSDSATHAALNSTYAPLTGAVHLDKLVGSASNAGPLIATALGSSNHLLGREGDVYTISTSHTIPVAAGRRVHIDLNGATLRFVNGGSLVIGTPHPTPYRTTPCPAGATYGASSVIVTDAAGVVPGDLMAITSPVEWVSGITMSGSYVVADVDVATGQVWVEGQIVTEITPAQVAAAGKSGGVNVEFYKVADSIELSNGTIESPDKTGASTLVQISGARRVVTDNLHILKPNRMGVTINRVGTWTSTGCSSRDHGYVVRDDGYLNRPEFPSGLGYGYGFLCNNTYFAHVKDGHSYSGWHGFDVARGTTYALFDGCVSHKDAYGWSSHEGNWIMHVRSCIALGGLGVTCRSLELIVEQSKLTTREHCIAAGDGRLNLIVQDCTLSSEAGVEVYQDPAAIPAYCRPSGRRSLLLIKNVTSRDARVMTLRTQGDAVLTGIVRYGKGGSTANTAVEVVGNGVDSTVTVTGATLVNVGSQAAFVFRDMVRVGITNVAQSGTVGLLGGSALAMLHMANAATPYSVYAENVTGTLERVFRIMSGNPTANVIRSTGFRWLLAGVTGTLKNALWNAVTGASTNVGIVSDGATVVTATGNVTLTP